MKRFWLGYKVYVDTFSLYKKSNCPAVSVELLATVPLMVVTASLWRVYILATVLPIRVLLLINSVSSPEVILTGASTLVVVISMAPVVPVPVDDMSIPPLIASMRTALSLYLIKEYEQVVEKNYSKYNIVFNKCKLTINV